ncbi:DUF2865 domain-containing protein [Bradyrhizobium sp. U87765 SZCCT0131]|uniref:DUF2865 domain-containing protein n=1 Tax=unclassified Bradyrhizobium TaxID=2631580 RepID=UPI001BA5769B|nr:MULTISPECIES: DUF2865 domain-containing protein [unclassified Bradyrhizobium]MBR1222068.1 DUF2865 domain-containing protein [Bradyrhizobium sp. U87765 SZCCT0131]MBR1263734.1 DUF2865 domain-containing protein [Bradyrhizobium sp. U87765 SZCCT0134]MBR1302696.1 DUF2865 domain-containing protein [Bradyrhizobium sp. U87765 SZCCT0110]MBR1319984.1 DUF2865 domain-containing protein [Bradyrhizobium sp. U87765 SZCCT0109]MBR1348903.1 DUF2865 domain-containing protein [Bradyrhizobium sp. U87765 SZCCT004
MMQGSRYRLTTALLLGLAVAGASTAGHAQDFFSALFGGFAPPQPQRAIPFVNLFDDERPAPRASTGGGDRATAYCVRTCDGRYFPVPPAQGESRAAACNSLCPTSETRVYYGGSIDDATAEGGKSYADLPNAFRYRKEIVAGCTCNGKDTFGLARVRIEDDATLRKGDIVAGANGLVVASGRADKRTAVNFTPVPASVRAKFDRLPVVARE